MERELIDKFKKEVKWSTPNPPNTGGQSVGMLDSRVILTHEDVEFTVTVGRYRSQLQNKELAMELFEYYLLTFK